MAERRDLTPAFVDAAMPPASGERWIADTNVKGFGLRLWAGPNGGGKAYSLRAKTESGCYTRRRYQKRFGSAFHWFARQNSDHPPEHFDTLGPWLEDARSWAQDEKRRLLGQLTAAEQRRLEWDEKGRKAEQTSLRAHLDRYLSARQVDGSQQTYSDQMYALLGYLPDGLLDRALQDLNPNDLIDAIVAEGRPLTQMLKLRGLLSQALASDDLAGAGRAFEARRNHEAFQEALQARWVPAERARIEALEQFRAPVMAYIAAEPKAFVPAAFLRVYLETTAKQAPLLKARWDQIVEGRWWLPSEAEKAWGRSEPPGEELVGFLEQHHERVRAVFGDTPFLFPSTPTAPISSVQRYWRRVAKAVALPDAAGSVSLSEFAMIASTSRLLKHEQYLAASLCSDDRRFDLLKSIYQRMGWI